MFEDRKDAGRQLAGILIKYRDENPLVIAIPRGGVAVAAPVARRLQTDLLLLVSRKLPLPDNSEAGFGAIAEDGSVYLKKEARVWLPDDVITRIIEVQKEVIRDRIASLRHGNPLPGLCGRTLILIDDGLAMGSTMQAAFTMCKKQDPRSIIVAVPVAGQSARRLFEDQADDLVILEEPAFFQAVAQVYRHWRDLTDEEVLRILEGMDHESDTV
ncbi:MAG: hypothetical protein JW881_08980 [Spirochaetales bacterium]|nr:hypothetical protein [Spirochaetales bacterium]